MNRSSGFLRFFHLFLGIAITLSLFACVAEGPDSFDKGNNEGVEDSALVGEEDGLVPDQGINDAGGAPDEGPPPLADPGDFGVGDGDPVPPHAVPIGELADPMISETGSPLVAKLEFAYTIEEICNFAYSDDKCDKPSWLEGSCNDYQYVKSSALNLSYQASNVIGVPEFDEGCEEYFRHIQNADNQMVQEDPPNHDFYTDSIGSGEGQIRFSKPKANKKADFIDTLEPKFCTFRVYGTQGQCKQFSIKLGYCVIQGYGDCGGTVGCTRNFTDGIFVPGTTDQWQAPCD